MPGLLRSRNPSISRLNPIHIWVAFEFQKVDERAMVLLKAAFEAGYGAALDLE